MRNRYLVLGLATFIAIAMAVPALGGPSNPIASSSANALKIAKKAKAAAAAAQTSADTAQSTANSAISTANSANSKATAAQTAATAAQTAANNANTNANTRYDHISHVDGGTSPSNNSDKALIAANCPAADDAATGGGWVAVGGGERDAQVEYDSTFYNDQWVVVANDIGLDAGNWSIQVTAQCIGT
jgi:hypothetical protein